MPSPVPYGPGGPAPTVTPSGQSILDRGYGLRTPATVVLALPARVPTTAYVPPASMPAQLGPTMVAPPGPLGPLSVPSIWPANVPGTVQPGP